MQGTVNQRYILGKDPGITEFWWPFGPCVGRYSIKTTTRQTEGRLLQLVIVDSRGAAPPMHIHHDADETFYIHDGALTIFLGNERIKAGPGDFVLGPKGVPHSYLVTSDRAAFLATFAPAGTRGRRVTESTASFAT